jgi:hypothetical protein
MDIIFNFKIYVLAFMSLKQRLIYNYLIFFLLQLYSVILTITCVTFIVARNTGINYPRYSRRE